MCDDCESAHLLRFAAEEGDAKARLKLGLIYCQGKEVERNDREAVRLFCLAAEQGEAEAQYALGLMYSQGRGVERDYYEALIWILVSFTSGAKITDDMFILSKKLSDTKIKSAEKEAARRFAEIEKRKNNA